MKNKQLERALSSYLLFASHPLLSSFPLTQLCLLLLPPLSSLSFSHVSSSLAPSITLPSLHCFFSFPERLYPSLPGVFET